MWSILFNVLTVNRHTYVVKTKDNALDACLNMMLLNNIKNEQSNEGEEEHPIRRSSTSSLTITRTPIIPMGRIRMFCLRLYSMKGLQDIIWT